MYPIILCHGVCRFDILWKEILQVDNSDDPGVDDKHYFKGIRTMLKKNGFEVFHTNVPWGASVNDRARVLKHQIVKILNDPPRYEKVHIIAHSMGGLDARHMMFDDRNNGQIHTRIASLTTISTPHGGSSFADWGTEHLSQVTELAKFIGIDLNAMNDLRTDSCQAFNEDPEVIRFEKQLSQTAKLQTYAGYQDWYGTFWPLKFSHHIITDKEGINDGLVSVKSARWHATDSNHELPKTDHLNELGWWDGDQIMAGEFSSQLLSRIHNLYYEIAQSMSRE